MIEPRDATPPLGRLLQLADDDQVAVATADLQAGQTVRVGQRQLCLLADVPLGHKVAVRAIAAGEKVRKYGCPIGSATSPIAAGQHVHVHNLKSDYLPTYVAAGYESPSAEGRSP
jgi:hypothetical protein